VDEVVSRIDVDAVLERIDIDELLARIDIDAVLDRVDIERLLDRIDPDRLLDRVDINRLIARLELDSVIERVDLDKVLARVDVNRVIGTVDVDAVVDRVDVNRVLEHLDTDALVARTELGSLITRSTSGVLAKGLDLLRTKLMTLDILVHGVADRVMRRPRAERVPSAAPWARELALQGRPGGMVSRFVAFLVDVAAVQLLFAAARMLLSLGYEVVFGRTWTASDHRILSGVGVAVLALGYFTVLTALYGRTLGKGLLGLQVRMVGRTPVTWLGALIRTAAFPLSTALFGAGLIIALFRSDRRTLNDLLAGTQVVYAWDARAARLRSLAERTSLEAPAPEPVSSQP
jgi:uncharacterized RDD family membrane protein YckC